MQIEVALKDHAASLILSWPTEQEKALEEARRLVKVKHPNVVRAFGAERVGDEIGLSMELVRVTRSTRSSGDSHRSARTRPQSSASISVARWQRYTASESFTATSKAHNVMREDGGRTVSMDFGTSGINRQPPGPGGDFAGTPLYLAPEVFAGSSRTMQLGDLQRWRACVLPGPGAIRSRERHGPRSENCTTGIVRRSRFAT